MTELEKMKRAKMYIDKLAQGINPINDESADENDVINNIRISRCLFYVSDILAKVINNDGQVVCPEVTHRSHKEPFFITDDQLNAFQYSDKPIPVSEIAKRLTELVDKSVYHKMNYKKIRGWLAEIGFLSEGIMPNGKVSLVPTESGEDAEIILEIRNGRTGEYPVVVYSIEAQQLIIDNIYAILAGQEL